MKIRDRHKFEKRIVLALVFLVMKTRKNSQIYVPKHTFKRHIDLLIGEEGKRHG